MHFYELIKEKSKEKIKIFVDMDGVIASYDYGKPLDFKNKRPLMTNIEVLRKISELNNVELFILSVCRKKYQILEKNDWLDKYAPFFKKENRFIISRDSKDNMASSLIKLEFFKEYKSSEKIIFIDDDNRVLSIIGNTLHHIELYQDSELID